MDEILINRTKNIELLLFLPAFMSAGARMALILAITRNLNRHRRLQRVVLECENILFYISSIERFFAFFSFSTNVYPFDCNNIPGMEKTLP